MKRLLTMAISTHNIYSCMHAIMHDENATYTVVVILWHHLMTKSTTRK